MGYQDDLRVKSENKDKIIRIGVVVGTRRVKIIYL